MLQTSVSKCPQEAYRGFAGLRLDLDWTCKIFSGQGCGKGTDGGAVERRLKKSNDFTLGQVAILLVEGLTRNLANVFLKCLTEQGRLLNKLSPSSCLGQVVSKSYKEDLFMVIRLFKYKVLIETGGLCTSTGMNLVQVNFLLCSVEANKAFVLTLSRLFVGSMRYQWNNWC